MPAHDPAPDQAPAPDPAPQGPTLHLVKLCVGVERPEELERWQALRAERARAAGADPRPRHLTRMRPRRADELLAGGSLYWVMKGAILARQRILALEEATAEDGSPRCAIVLDPALIRTAPAPRRAFQGWRYLRADEAPPDLDAGAEGDAALPPALAEALAALGVR
ncbi:DUF1489 family protein [Oceanicella actignis]|uniref:Lysophospholipase n=1 Tax=Oceanicella actignis TaxID=1189325 RepID=A0A1M7TSQ3_9RHOB|nr:DUF1489 domain-containing protein [Oceanicella actignis]SET76250.1 hypothetical protein SAMN04488119_10921 [Oceanicella actignis]SHN73784.1 hypothetical protein SAMN05216200_109101 [Oceanicella actignis]